MTLVVNYYLLVLNQRVNVRTKISLKILIELKNYFCTYLWRKCVSVVRIWKQGTEE